MVLPIMERLGIEVTPLYCEMDGTFPNHEPDPTVPANLTDLIATVKAKGLMAGVAFDGDCDRVGVVDEKGQIIFGDMLLAIFARSILEGPSRRPVHRRGQVLQEPLRRHRLSTGARP